jgi:hypothetical protein
MKLSPFSGFPFACADTAAADGRWGGRWGSNVYEVNPWLWRQFGRGKPRLGGLTAEQTTERQDNASDEWTKRGAETRHLEGCSI